MNKTVLKRKLTRERRKLDLLIDATMGEPIALNREILDQSRRVDALVARLQERGKGG